MLTVDQREQIRRAYFIEGKSIRQIARERHHDRRTLRKALHDAGPPRYTLRERRPRPILGPFLAVIDHWLEEDQQRPPKQRHTAKRIYDRLVAERAFQGGESTVRQYVREHRPSRAQVFIPLEHDPGEAQVDWGRAEVIMAGRQTSVRLFCLRLCYSQKSFVMTFPNERREAFFAGHLAGFSFIGGVPRRITYDNLPTAVQRILKGGKREEQREFIAFRSHYPFESNFCRPGKEGAHEKGLVENLVGYVRRNFLVPLPEVASFEELNALLLARCRASDGRLLPGQGRTVGEAWEAERPHLLPPPRFPWPCCTVHALKAGRSSVVRFEGNRYSVPAGYASRNVLLRAYVDRVDIAHGERIIASHRRTYGRGQDILDPYHYVPVLQVKPGAFHHAKAVRRYPWPPVFRRALAFLKERHPDGKGVREFLRILASQGGSRGGKTGAGPGAGLTPSLPGCRRRPSPSPSAGGAQTGAASPRPPFLEGSRPHGAGARRDPVQPAPGEGALMEADLLLRSYLKGLKLPTIAGSYRKFAQEAASTNQPYERYLLALTEAEVHAREANAERKRIARARFPSLKTLDSVRRQRK